MDQTKTTTVVPTLEEFGLKPRRSFRTFPRGGPAAAARSRPAAPSDGTSRLRSSGSRGSRSSFTSPPFEPSEPDHHEQVEPVHDDQRRREHGEHATHRRPDRAAPSGSAAQPE